MAVDPIEEWLGTRLKAAYPVDDWVLEGVTSALLLLEDRADAVDTIANFLGTADAPGTNEQIVDELFRRKRGDATGAGAGGTQSRASEPAPSSAGPSRDASSARARATSSSDAHDARVDVAEKKKKSGGERFRRDGVSAKTKPSSPPTTKKNTPRRSVRPEELAKKDINCLGCGKIYRCAPRDGALSTETRAFLERGCVCVFCGDAVVVALADGAEMALPPDETPKTETDVSASSRSRKPSVSGSRRPEAGDADAAARDAKDRLVEFDRTAAARTTVIDDQSDWFEIESNAWLDEDEREEAKAQARELEEAREAARRDRSTRVTLDLLGRRVDDAETRGDSETKNAGSGFVLRTNSVEDTMDTMVGVRATKHRPEDEPSNARAVGAAVAAAVSTATRDPRLFRVGANPMAGFAPAFSSDKSATKKKGKKGPFADKETTETVVARGARNKPIRVQDESPFDVVARETEARRDEN